MKKHLNKIITGLITLCVLAFVFWWGGNAPGLRGWHIAPKPQTASHNPANENILPHSEPSPQSSPDVPVMPETEDADPGGAGALGNPEDKPDNGSASETAARPGGTQGGLTADEKVALAAKMTGASSEGVEKGNAEYSEKQGMAIDKSTGKDQYLTAPVPEGKPIPVEPQNAVITDKPYTCTLSVRCDTILKNISWLDPEKTELVPGDGVIFPERTVSFYEGESVFHVLLREMKKNKIHMEFKNTPIYNSAYIEGIHNLYEFDCGELSGWMYQVNGWFPNYGCSRYRLKQGDRIEWVYTCDLGVDVGGYYAAAGD
jgi:hypothetical protein